MNDDRVVDADVLMDEDVSETDSHAHALGIARINDSATAEDPHRVAVVPGCGRCVGAADVLLAVCSSRRDWTEPSAARRRRTTRISSTMTYRLEELAVRAIDSVLLVRVDLPGLGFPPHPSGWIVVEEQSTIESDSAGDFQWSAVKDEQVDFGRQVNLEGGWNRFGEVRCDVNVGGRSGGACCVAAVKVGELGAAAPQDLQCSCDCGALHEAMMAQPMPHRQVLDRGDHGQREGSVLLTS